MEEGKFKECSKKMKYDIWRWLKAESNFLYFIEQHLILTIIILSSVTAFTITLLAIKLLGL